METRPESTLTKSQILTSLSGDSLAKLSALLEKDKDLKTPEALYSLRLLGFLPTKDLNIFFSKTLKVYLVTAMEKLSRLYLGFSPTWGMTLNGVFLTAKNTPYRKTGNACSLADVLEENVGERFFVSEETQERLLQYRSNQYQSIPSQLDKVTGGLSARTLLKVNRMDKIVQVNKVSHSNDRVYSLEGVSPTLNTMQGGNRQPFVLMPGERVRKLTPVECERLQGFPDGWTEGVSVSGRYKCVGNAVTVDVVEFIFSRLFGVSGYSNTPSSV